MWSVVFEFWYREEMGSELPEEVKKFEEFLEERLKPRLLNAIAQRDMVFEKQKIFSDLRKNIENMEKNTVTSMRTLVNLGSEIYTEAEAPETRSIFVEVGYGFYVEFTWSEALNYIDAREKLLSRYIFGNGIDPRSLYLQSHLQAEFGQVNEALKNYTFNISLRRTKSHTCLSSSPNCTFSS